MKKTFLEVLSVIVITGELVMIAMMLFIWKVGASTVDANVVNLIYGLALGFHSAFMIVIGYWFGSSQGSADKTQLMATASKVAAENLNAESAPKP
jgi:steroid 5-alpha reductase family enzyme